MCNRMWTIPEPKGLARTTAMEAEKLNLVSEGCNSRIVSTVTIFFLYVELSNKVYFEFNVSCMMYNTI